ncbi:hypothetical protein [Nostoc sp. CMAA1605]|nr:hypothetical protein [Nostoc sp. CMAA1605]
MKPREIEAEEVNSSLIPPINEPFPMPNTPFPMPHSQFLAIHK